MINVPLLLVVYHMHVKIGRTLIALVGVGNTTDITDLNLALAMTKKYSALFSTQILDSIS